MSVQYPIRAVAKLTGITIDTLRAWERRYQAVKPERTDRGRLYSDADVRRLLLLRTAVERGHAIGQVAGLSDAELQDLARASFPSPVPPIAGTAPPALPVELLPILDAIHAFDYDTTNLELSRLALLLSPADLVHKVVLPLMRLAGENWENGTFQVAHEHMLSACVRNLLGGLVRMQRPATGAARLLFTTPAGELHEFGILAAAMLAVTHQFQVAYLGPNLPVSEILFAAGESATQVVVLGIMELNATPAVRLEVARLAAQLSPTTELWLGGSGAVRVAAGTEGSSALVLDSLNHFEQHLSRLKPTYSPQGLR